MTPSFSSLSSSFFAVVLGKTKERDEFQERLLGRRSGAKNGMFAVGADICLWHKLLI